LSQIGLLRINKTHNIPAYMTTKKKKKKKKKKKRRREEEEEDEPKPESKRRRTTQSTGAGCSLRLDAGENRSI